MTGETSIAEWQEETVHLLSGTSVLGQQKWPCKAIVKLCTSHQLNTVNICRASLSKVAEHKLLPSSRGTVSNAGHIQDHKKFYKFKRKEIVQCLCLDDQNTVKLN